MDGIEVGFVLTLILIGLFALIIGAPLIAVLGVIIWAAFQLMAGN